MTNGLYPSPPSSFFLKWSACALCGRKIVSSLGPSSRTDAVNCCHLYRISQGNNFLPRVVFPWFPTIQCFTHLSENRVLRNLVHVRALLFAKYSESTPQRVYLPPQSDRYWISSYNKRSANNEASTGTACQECSQSVDATQREVGCLFPVTRALFI